MKVSVGGNKRGWRRVVMMSHHIVKQMSRDIIIIIIIICDDDEMLEMDSRMRWGRRRTEKNGEEPRADSTTNYEKKYEKKCSFNRKKN